MTGYKLSLAMLCGAGFTALVAVSLNLPVISLAVFGFLAPGAIILVPVKAIQPNSAIPLLVANFGFYAVLAAAFFYWKGSHYDVRRLRSWSISLLVPVLFVVALALWPRTDPLLPHRMDELARQEADLRTALPLGTTWDQARAVLQARKIEFYESENAVGVIFLNSHTSISATEGDRDISSEIPTEASQFPCGYRITLVLLFGPDGKVKARYINRMPICP